MLKIKEKFNAIEKRYEEHKENMIENHPVLATVEAGLEGVAIGLIFAVPTRLLLDRHTDKEMIEALDYCQEAGYYGGANRLDADGNEIPMSNKDVVKCVKRIYRKKL